MKMNLAYKVLASICWVRALRRISRDDPARGLSHLRKMEDLGVRNMEYFILRGLAEGMVGNFRDSIRYCSQAVKQIEEGDVSNLNESEKQYLKQYSRCVMLKSSECLGMTNNKLESQVADGKLDFANVRKAFLKNYPLSQSYNVKSYGCTSNKRV